MRISDGSLDVCYSDLSSRASQPFLMLAALVAVYIILGVLYESLVHPLTILSTLPSACIGAIVLLWAWQLDFSIMALIGLILLIGIVKKNGILLIDFAIHAQRERDRKSTRLNSSH